MTHPSRVYNLYNFTDMKVELNISMSSSDIVTAGCGKYGKNACGILDRL
jgi:hypothetical protein